MTICACCSHERASPRCPDHGIDLTAQTISQMVDQVLKLPEDTPIALLAPLISDRKGEHGQVFEDLARQGFVRVRIDGHIHELDARPGAGSEAQTQHRSRGRPVEGAPRHQRAAGRVL